MRGRTDGGAVIFSFREAENGSVEAMRAMVNEGKAGYGREGNQGNSISTP